MTADAMQATGGRTIGRLVVTGRPTRQDLTDAVFVLTIGTLALVGFSGSFDSWRFLAVGAVGLVLGLLVAHVGNALGTHWAVVALMTVVAFFLVGGATALRADAVGGVLPSLAVISDLGLISVHGWKDLLTTLPPVDGSGPFLVLPYVLGLVTGSLGLTWARRSRHMAWPLLFPVAAFVLVILMGTLDPVLAWGRGLAVVALSFLWAATRRRRTLRVVGTGGSSAAQTAIGTVLVAAALAAGYAGAHLSPAGSDRFVLRSLVAPPFDITRYPSPLVGYRKYTEGAQRYWDQPLLRVHGLRAGDRVRIAVLDDYSGTAWVASAPGPSGGGFHRVGTSIARGQDDPTTTPEDVTVTVEAGYASNNDLNVWVPGVGSASRVTFGGAGARDLAESLRYDTGTGQAVVARRLQPGTVLRTTGRPVPVVPERGFEPAGGTAVGAVGTEVVASAVTRLSTAAPTPWGRAQAVANAFRSRGAYSDGTAPGERQYLPGHGVGRLAGFVGGRQLVGNDEQYASTYALALNELGMPARVVLGADVPDGGVVKGRDVHAWVEVQGSSGTWFAVPQTAFMPDRDKRPDRNPPPPVAEQNAADVPPPNAAAPPGSLDSLMSVDPSTVTPPPLAGPSVPAWVWTVLRWVGAPLATLVLVVGLLAAAQAVRRRRRRRTGAPSRRFAHGWTDVLDRARDLGMQVPAGLTRTQQARLVGFPALAAQADVAVFGAEEPTEEAIAAYWKATRAARADLTARAPLGRRMRRPVSLASLFFRDPRPVERLPKPPTTVRSRRRLALRQARSAS